MDTKKEISRIIEQMTPLFNRLGELSKEELDEAGNLFTRWMQLNEKRNDELEAKIVKTSETSQLLKERIDEYELTISITEAFLAENDIFDQFLVFSDELIKEFYQGKKPHLTLVQ